MPWSSRRTRLFYSPKEFYFNRQTVNIFCGDASTMTLFQMLRNRNCTITPCTARRHSIPVVASFCSETSSARRYVHNYQYSLECLLLPDIGALLHFTHLNNDQFRFDENNSTFGAFPYFVGLFFHQGNHSGYHSTIKLHKNKPTYLVFGLLIIVFECFLILGTVFDFLSRSS